MWQKKRLKKGPTLLCIRAHFSYITTSWILQSVFSFFLFSSDNTHCLHGQARFIIDLLQVCCSCSKCPIYHVLFVFLPWVQWYQLLQHILQLLTLLNKQGVLTPMIRRDRQGRYSSHYNLHISRRRSPSDLAHVIRESSRSKTRIWLPSQPLSLPDHTLNPLKKVT